MGFWVVLNTLTGQNVLRRNRIVKPPTKPAIKGKQQDFPVLVEVEERWFGLRPRKIKVRYDNGEELYTLATDFNCVILSEREAALVRNFLRPRNEQERAADEKESRNPSTVSDYDQFAALKELNGECEYECLTLRQDGDGLVRIFGQNSGRLLGFIQKREDKCVDLVMDFTDEYEDPIKVNEILKDVPAAAKMAAAEAEDSELEWED